MKALVPLVIEDGYINFLLEEEDKSDHTITVNVYEVLSWEMDNKPCEKEHYLKAYIKWDGCSHVWFGDEDCYIHLCGKMYWDLHAKVMNAVYEYASNNIALFDKEVAE